MNTTSKWLMALTLLAGPMVDSIARADMVAYDTITGSSASGSGDWFGYNPPLNAYYVVGDQFTPTATGYISALESSMFSGGAADPVTLALYTDNGGTIGTLIEDLTVNTSGNFNYYNCTHTLPGPLDCHANFVTRCLLGVSIIPCVRNGEPTTP